MPDIDIILGKATICGKTGERVLYVKKPAFSLCEGRDDGLKKGDEVHLCQPELHEAVGGHLLMPRLATVGLLKEEGDETCMDLKVVRIDGLEDPETARQIIGMEIRSERDLEMIA